MRKPGVLSDYRDRRNIHDAAYFAALELAQTFKDFEPNVSLA
ncbi:MAG TPA: hypothetical protein VGG82_12360 [Casimicrobiaceae bacterium]